MYTPITNFAALAGPIASLDFAANVFLGISWSLLLPYTLFGIGLMIYSQSRFFKGERALKREDRTANVVDATVVDDVAISADEVPVEAIVGEAA